MNFKEIRKAHGFTQEYIAKQAGVTKQYISIIEKGAKKPSVNLAKKLGKILRVDWRYFF